MHRPTGRLLGVTVAALVLAGCASEPARPSSAVSPSAAGTTTTSTPATPSAPPVSPSSSTTPVPGEPCDPADGSPDCTDATSDGLFRYVEGYADCVAQLPGEEHSMCTDLDGDGRAGYPDSG
ncbi:hypothetical protein [Cellulomonas sp. Root137]|uniref:hypothetical protein n=1 Tax=Cellulomonas sp. Root137 TaxID=1736459 RepID=UPI0006F7175C|nr:hypothetical protein [Cellulomonas sp. Root137]KQY47231.1 hypothetical protein ASD18_07700 [Cellulomonas sp. Root137]